VGSQKLCSLFPICFWKAEQRGSRVCALAEPFGNAWQYQRFTTPCFLSPVPYVLERASSPPASEQRLVPGLASQVEVVSDHLCCSCLLL